MRGMRESTRDEGHKGPPGLRGPTRDEGPPGMGESTRDEGPSRMRGERIADVNSS